ALTHRSGTDHAFSSTMMPQSSVVPMFSTSCQPPSDHFISPWAMSASRLVPSCRREPHPGRAEAVDHAGRMRVHAGHLAGLDPQLQYAHYAFVVRYEFSWSPWLTVKLGLATRRHIGEVLSNLVHLDLGLPARPQAGRADISRHHEVKPGCL